MTKIVVLGAGLVGAPIAFDLAKDKNFKISIVDKDAKPLEKFENTAIKAICRDLSNAGSVKEIVKDFDFVVSAVPGFMGFQTIKAVIESKKNVVDIAFFPEDPFLLDELAKKNNVIAITDCGVAPGMSNILVGHAHNLLDKTENVEIYVGGLPQIRQKPFEYKAVFSPIDVIEEYTRPARLIENFQVVTKPALTECELMDFSKIGTLEAFNSDGLRSLAYTIDGKNMKEKTLRYPGHVEKMKLFRETGFFDKNEIEINGVKISPLDFTSKILFPKWKLEKNQHDITVMKILVEGYKNEKYKSFTYDLFDRYDSKSETHSMARTTGYTASSAIRMLISNIYTQVGITVPEFLGKNQKCYEFIIDELAKRGIHYIEKID
jgi:lysine 6-dehydrogenase